MPRRGPSGILDLSGRATGGAPLPSAIRRYSRLNTTVNRCNTRLARVTFRAAGETRKGGAEMTIPHEPWLVALSIAIAIQGSFVGLSLARELDSAEGFRRRLALAGSALTLATGVWSMHFVGMLAANFPGAIDYLVLPTLISFLICVIVVGAGVYAAHAWGAPML